jgi:hypothetical protein
MYVTPVAHGVNPPPSSWHRNVTVESESVNEKVAVVSLVTAAGSDVIVGAGGAAAVAAPTKIPPTTKATIAAA